MTLRISPSCSAISCRRRVPPLVAVGASSSAVLSCSSLGCFIVCLRGRKCPFEEAGGYEPKQRTSGKETLRTRDTPSYRSRIGEHLKTVPKLSFFGPWTNFDREKEELPSSDPLAGHRWTYLVIPPENLRLLLREIRRFSRRQCGGRR